MTDNDTHGNDESGEDNDEPRKVKDLSHTHPHHDEPFGSTGTYDRGGAEEPVDEADAAEEESTGDDEDDEERVADGGRRRRKRTVADLDHTPPEDVGAQGAYERGPVARERDDAV